MKPTEKIEYIEKNMNYGKIINWDKIDKEFKKLKCPKDKYQVDLPFNKTNTFIIFSERDSGKTTNVILKSLIAYKMYAVKTEWVRQLLTMIKPTNVTKMFDTIKQFGYISKITNGKYSDIYYYRKELYLCNYSENEKGKPQDIDNTPFMRFNAIEDWQNIKSNYTSPDGDIIVFDEFQAVTNKEDEFSHFYHLVSSIKRERRSTKILFLGNTLTPYNYYFREMDLTKYIVKMKPNDRIIITTQLGMSIYIEWFNRLNANNKQTEKERIAELQYYGFKGLNSIIGGEWEIKNYPHITRELDKNKTVLEDFFLKFQLYNLNLKLCYEENIGLFVYVRPCSEMSISRAYEDKKIIFVDYPPLLVNEIYGVGNGIQNLSKFWNLYRLNRFLFSTNDIGELLTEFITTYK